MKLIMLALAINQILTWFRLFSFEDELDHVSKPFLFTDEKAFGPKQKKGKKK